MSIIKCTYSDEAPYKQEDLEAAVERFAVNAAFLVVGDYYDGLRRLLQESACPICHGLPVAIGGFDPSWTNCYYCYGKGTRSGYNEQVLDQHDADKNFERLRLDAILKSFWQPSPMDQDWPINPVTRALYALKLLICYAMGWSWSKPEKGSFRERWPDWVEMGEIYGGSYYTGWDCEWFRVMPGIMPKTWRYTIESDGDSYI